VLSERRQYILKLLGNWNLNRAVDILLLLYAIPDLIEIIFQIVPLSFAQDGAREIHTIEVGEGKSKANCARQYGTHASGLKKTAVAARLASGSRGAS
jgi:hypothetical protein